MIVTGWLSTEEDIGGQRTSFRKSDKMVIKCKIQENLEVLRCDGKDQFVGGHYLVLLADEAHVREQVGATREEAGEQRRQLRLPAPPVSHHDGLVIRSQMQLCLGPN